MTDPRKTPSKGVQAICTVAMLKYELRNAVENRGADWFSQWRRNKAGTLSYIWFSA